MMMIGGGGSSCIRADHGIGVTEANSPSLANLDEKDFGMRLLTIYLRRIL